MRHATVAVASRSFSRHELLRSELLSRCEQVRFNDSGESLSGLGLVEFLRGHEKAIIGLERIDNSTLAALPELSVISKYGVGVDHLDLNAMAAHHVALGWTGGVNRRSVAELVVAFAIALLHRIPEAWGEIREGRWRQLAGRQLSAATIGVIGCGHVGKEVSKLMRALGCRVLAHDILDFPAFYVHHSVEPVSLDTLLREADVVTLHVPLNPSTEMMLDASRLRTLRRGAVVINTARGGLLDEDALRELLGAGHLAGAALDVFRTEPPDSIELLRLPTFMATPHIGGSSVEAILAMGRAAIAGLDATRVPEPDWPVPRALRRV